MAQTPTRNHAPRGHHKQYARMSLLNPQRHVVPTAVLTQSKHVPITTARPVTIVVPKLTVTRPRQAKTIITKPNSGLSSLGKFDGKADEGFLVGYSVSNPQNTDDDATFKVKEPKFKVKKPESEVYVSPSSSAKTKKHDDMTKKEAKGKSPVELSTGFRNLSEESEDFSDNSINEVNAAILTVGQNSPNITNTFSTAGPSNAAASPTYGKSSFIDASHHPNDPDMPELKDITYFDDEDDVGVEAGFNNLETYITVSPIPTTRVHKDHL
nr:hypothetical protein [Tanacetum cinerariifolium]